eukprot:SAG31_NODE_2_length_46263_cov_45.908043_11_plen_247_part_00
MPSYAAPEPMPVPGGEDLDKQLWRAPAAPAAAATPAFFMPGEPVPGPAQALDNTSVAHGGPPAPVVASTPSAAASSAPPPSISEEGLRQRTVKTTPPTDAPASDAPAPKYSSTDPPKQKQDESERKSGAGGCSCGTIFCYLAILLILVAAVCGGLMMGGVISKPVWMTCYSLAPVNSKCVSMLIAQQAYVNLCFVRDRHSFSARTTEAAKIYHGSPMSTSSASMIRSQQLVRIHCPKFLCICHSRC